MPLGRVYQAPPVVAAVPRNTPIYGINGLKSVSNSDLVITGRAVRSKQSKSKSPSPAPGKPSVKTNKTSYSSVTTKPSLPSATNKVTQKKSPSPGLRAGKRAVSRTRIEVNNNQGSGGASETDNRERQRSWSPEPSRDNSRDNTQQSEDTDNRGVGEGRTEDKVTNGNGVAHTSNQVIIARQLDRGTVRFGLSTWLSGGSFVTGLLDHCAVQRLAL